MKVGLVQPNPSIGALEGNVDRCLEGIAQAAAGGSDLIVLPEMVVPGCHPKDILLDSEFITAINIATADLAAEAEKYPPTIVGTILSTDRGSLLNAAVLLDGGKFHLLAAKRHLPNNDVAFESISIELWRRKGVHQKGMLRHAHTHGSLSPAQIEDFVFFQIAKFSR